MFLGLWALILGPLAVEFAGSALAGLIRGDTAMLLPGVAVPGMLGFAVVLTLSGRWLARQEPAQLLAFLRDVAGAELQA